MKQLTLIRHAKAVHGSPDIDRALSPRGIFQARWLGTELWTQAFSFDVLFSSNARRTLETAAYLCEELGLPEDTVKAEPDLYSFDGQDLYRYIGRIDEQINHAVIVGHNPAIHWLAQDLTGAVLDKVPTCTFLHIALDIDYWLEAGVGSGDLVEWYYPPRS